MTELVSGRAGPLVLDTNVLVHLARGRAAGRQLDSDHGLAAAAYRPIICIVTVGECLSIARSNDWGPRKQQQLHEIFRQLVVADINDPSVLECYAEIGAWCRRNGRKMAKNDLWIAAVVHALQGWLLTTDRDFCALPPHLIDVEFVDPQTLPKGP